MGGTNIKAGVVDENYKIIGKASCKTKCPRPAEEIAQDMAKVAVLAVKDASVDMSEVSSVGVGSPGMIDPKNGVIEYAGNLSFENVPIAAMISEILNKPVHCANDADAAAYGEFIAGAGRGCRNFIAITLGTGVGSGIIVDGKLLSGSNNAVGEFGHTVIVYDGEPCTCGRRGCYEAYASATALIRQTREAMEEHPESVMWELTNHSLGNVGGATAFDAMRAGDETGRAVVDRYIGYIACGITNAVNTFQPEMVCIGGGICNEGDTLLVPIRERVRRDRFASGLVESVNICRAELGNDAGIIGAAYL